MLKHEVCCSLARNEVKEPGRQTQERCIQCLVRVMYMHMGTHTHINARYLCVNKFGDKKKSECLNV